MDTVEVTKNCQFCTESAEPNFDIIFEICADCMAAMGLDTSLGTNDEIVYTGGN